MAEQPNPYDQVPYPVLSHQETHPDRIATVALLLGLDPAPIERCRVLEVGCASGGNLLPMAASLPGTTFLGIDYSAAQVATACELAGELGLTNIRFECADIRTFDPAGERFDYIVAHGVYSWVPPEAQDALLALCARALTSRGIAYISYNALPGWSLMLALRDIMLFGAGQATGPSERLARATGIIRLLAEHAPADSYLAVVLEGYAAVRESTASIAGADGGALTLHDHLSEYNQPRYLHQFTAHAARYGLEYLGDADFSAMFPYNLRPEAVEALSAGVSSRVEYDQLLDWLGNRGFRRTLLCRDASAVSLSIQPTPGLLARLRARSRARPPEDLSVAGDSPAVFVSPRGARLTTNHPLSKAAIVELALAYPESVPLPVLFDRAAARLAAGSPAEDPGAEDRAMAAATLVQGFSYDSDLVELRTWEPPLTRTVSQRPVASPYARALVVRSIFSVPSAHHLRVNLQPAQAAVLSLLDGTRDRDALAAELSEMLTVDSEPRDEPPSLPRLIDETLGFLARAGLLVG